MGFFLLRTIAHVALCERTIAYTVSDSRVARTPAPSPRPPSSDPEGHMTPESYAEGKRGTMISSPASAMQTAAKLNSGELQGNRGTQILSPASVMQRSAKEDSRQQRLKMRIANEGQKSFHQHPSHQQRRLCPPPHLTVRKVQEVVQQGKK